MSVFERIRKEIPLGMEMCTPVEKKPFRINFIDTEKKTVYFSAGKELERIHVGVKTRIRIPDRCFDRIPEFLKGEGIGEGWYLIGTRYDVAPRGTVQEHLDFIGWGRGSVGLGQKKSHTSDANYIAVVLEHLKIVEVDPRIPSKVRLKQKTSG
jgi:hypothetical protein